jgi:protease-4
MRKGRPVLLLVLVFVCLFLAAAVSMVVLEFGRPPSISASSYLEIPLSGPIEEYSSPNVWASILRGGRPLSVHDVWLNLKKARNDGRIKGVLLRLGMLGGDWAKCAEIRDAVLDFRKSGKPVYAFVEEAPEFDKEYYLATACDRIILHPLGWLGITGAGGVVPFLKKGLEKLGIEAEVEHVEEYKTAYDMFTESGFTPAHREMLESIIGDQFETYVRTVAAARRKTEAEIRSLIDEAFFQGARAVEAGLVDDLLYEDQVAALFEKDGRPARRVGLSDYDRVPAVPAGLGGGRRVALIYGSGAIHGGGSTPATMGAETVAGWIRTAREDSSIAAVVFRVDSPGGSAVASDTIWREVMLCRKAKPFVVSMSDVAGSGGYWISMAAHRIVAQPQTLTGSIGVLSGKVNLEKLLAKLGVTSGEVLRGARADFFTPFRPWTREERALIKKQILWIYDRFLAQAAEGRRLTKEDIDTVGRGRVWTGRQARQIGLVDEIGGLDAALRLARELAGIDRDADIRLAVWPKRESLIASLFGGRRSGAEALLPEGVRRIIDWAAALGGDRMWAIMPLVPSGAGLNGLF